MSDMHPVTEAALAREALKRISDEKNIPHQIIHILELVAHNSVGLGEVLQDYAHQACGQLRDIVRSASHMAKGSQEQLDADVILNAHFVLGSVQSVLTMIPAGLQRNKAETIGEKEKLSVADIAQAAQAFLNTPDIIRLMSAEECEHLVALLLGMSEQPITSAQEPLRVVNH